MATWIQPIDTETDPDAPLKSELAKRWDSNVIAFAECASGAPYMQSSLHPYDGAYIGDGNDGVLFDFTIDGGVTEVAFGPFASSTSYVVSVEDIYPSGSKRLFTQVSTDGITWVSHAVSTDYYTVSSKFSAKQQFLDAGILGEPDVVDFGSQFGTITANTTGFSYFRFVWEDLVSFSGGKVRLYKKTEYNG